ncbi:MAG: hypothetical protein QXS02_03885 [Candidatus Thermoplasmatota archaeon]
MRIKLMIGVIVTIFLLMMIPSISAIEYNSVVNANNHTQILSERMRLSGQRNDDSSNPVLQRVKQVAGTKSFVDVKLILMVVLNILTTILYGRSSFYRFTLNILCVILMIQEFISGENIMGRCPNLNAGLILAFFDFLTGIEWRFIQNRVLAVIFILITLIIGKIIAYIAMIEGHSVK